MRTRHIYIVDDLLQAARCVESARMLGVHDTQLSLIAGPETPLDAMPYGAARPVEADPDPADTVSAMGHAGLLFGMVGACLPALGVTIAGAALVSCAGVVLGSWSTTLLGQSVPRPQLRSLEHELDSGCVLLLVDEEREHLPCLDLHICAEGARQFDVEVHSVLI